MSDFATPLPLALPRSPRRAALFAASALGLAVAALAWRLSPTPAPALALGGVIGLAALTFAALIETGEAALFAKIFGAVAAFAALAAAGDPTRATLPFAFGSLGLLGFGAWRVFARPTLGLSGRATAAVALGLVAALAAFNAWYVIVSQDLMIADFMFYRIVSIAVGTLARAGKIVPLAINLAGSMAKDYSWAPALLPGLALAAFGLLSRAVYQGAILVCYAAPALLALAWAAREIAGRARDASPAAFVFALAAVAAAYPFGIVVAARGMPDIGGLALVVLALRLAEKLAQALALPSGHDSRLRKIIAKLAFALALTLFAMFLFRRWYAFAALGLAVALGFELALAAWRGAKVFRWRGAALGAAVGALTLTALLAPVLADWLPNPAAHDYALMYAAYRKTNAMLATVVGDWCGFAPLALALGGGLFVMARGGGRFARMAFVSGPVAAALFLRVQSPYPHHLYLLAPWLTLFIAAPLLWLFSKSRPAGLAGLAALGLMTLTPAGALAPKGWFPIAGRPHLPRTDMAELARLKGWVDARATPSHKVCGLGSSYTFSGQLIAELWQLKADKTPLTGSKAKETSVGMTDVDTVDGPPNPAMKDCAVMIVGDPVQTHVIPSYQITVTLPSREMLEGVGIGAHYRRSGEAFHLEHGVNAIVFEQTAPLVETDMAALAGRWRAARALVESAVPAAR